MAALIAVFSLTAAAHAGNQFTRRLSFPKQFSLGTIHYYYSAHDSDETLPCANLKGSVGKVLGEARGDVMAPPAKNTHLYLFPSYDLVAQPEVFRSLDPNLFDCICFANKFVMEPATKVVAPLAHMTGLRRLELESAELTDKEVAQLKPLINLEYLSLSTNIFSGATLKELSGMTKLYSFDLSANKLTPAAYAAVAQLKNLEHLRLNHCGVDDQAIVVLAKLDKLQDLQIGQSKITKKSIPLLKGMKSLTMLGMVGSTLPAKDYALFAGSRIRRIGLSDTQFSPAEIAIIQRSLPGVYLSISHNLNPVAGDNKQLFAPLH